MHSLNVVSELVITSTNIAVRIELTASHQLKLNAIFHIGDITVDCRVVGCDVNVTLVVVRDFNLPENYRDKFKLHSMVVALTLLFL